jgi:hypothetical protein
MLRFLRQHRAVERMLALWLLLLAASPCTAPFSTLDLGALQGAPAVDSAKSKASHDDAIAAPALAIAIHPDDRRVRSASISQQRRLARPRGHIVLRL